MRKDGRGRKRPRMPEIASLRQLLPEDPQREPARVAPTICLLADALFEVGRLPTPTLEPARVPFEFHEERKLSEARLIFRP
jgi:hypothetical protein